MFKKHYLLIIVLLTIGSTVAITESARFIIGRDHPRIYEMCRSAIMSSVDGDRPWKYMDTSYYIFPEFIVTLIFTDRGYIEDCQVQRNGSEWQVNHVIWLNKPAGMP